MNTIIEKPKKKMGRPHKKETGKNLWIPAELLETVQVLINAHKQKQVKK